MKRSIILIALIFLPFNIINAQENPIKGGFGFNIVIGVPSDTYGYDPDRFVGMSKFQVGSFWGLQLGNRWYFSPSERFGLGLMSNWFDFTIGAKAGKTADFDWGRIVIDASIIEIGPVATVAIIDDLGIDAYYNLRPTVFSSALVSSNITGDQNFGTVGFGFSHAIGGAVRYKVFSFGVEYVVGIIKSREAGTENLIPEFGTSYVDLNSLRFNVGFKF